MRIEILMIGKVADKAYQKLIDTYLDRCRRRLPVEIIHCKNHDELYRRLDGREQVILLDEHAQVHSTGGFVDWFDTKVKAGLNRLTFCLGAADGHAPQVRGAASEQLSLSPLTMNHQLALLVFCEQLYRAMAIMFREPYHKE